MGLRPGAYTSDSVGGGKPIILAARKLDNQNHGKDTEEVGWEQYLERLFLLLLIVALLWGFNLTFQGSYAYFSVCATRTVHCSLHLCNNDMTEFKVLSLIQKHVIVKPIKRLSELAPERSTPFTPEGLSHFCPSPILTTKHPVL
jgi:hypothetical protein